MNENSTIDAGKELSRGAVVNLGQIVTDLEGVWRLAQNMAKSTIVPKDFIDKPSNILVAIQIGAEVGLAPMQALQSIAVINGRPSLWGDGLLALVVSSHLCEGVEETFNEATQTATCTAHRKGWKKPITHSFSKADAEKAGLMTKDTYRNYLRRMLQMRARSWALRDAFPDVLRGLAVADEVQDMPAIEVVAEGAARTVEAAVTRLMPQTAPTATASAPVVPPAAAVPVTESSAQEKTDAELELEAAKKEIARLTAIVSAAAPAAVVEEQATAPAVVEGDVVEQPAAPAATEAPALIAEDDRRRLMGAARQAGVSVDELKAWLHKKHGITSTKAIRVDQYTVLFAAVGEAKGYQA